MYERGRISEFPVLSQIATLCAFKCFLGVKYESAYRGSRPTIENFTSDFSLPYLLLHSLLFYFKKSSFVKIQSILYVTSMLVEQKDRQETTVPIAFSFLKKKPS